MPLIVGQVINADYRIVKLLGQGGGGAVYKAWNLRLNCACALKENLAQDSSSQRQFKLEAQLLANLSHPNLVGVTNYFELPGQGQYLVMDFVDGDDLEHKIQKIGPLSLRDSINWISQICDALIYLHSQTPPIIHRDIKPANIKITSQGRAVLVDFGIAKIFTPNAKTTQGARAVTPGYAPPEQYGNGITDVRSDIYALGATLYTLLAGQEPQESVLRFSGDALFANLLGSNISPVLRQVIMQAMMLTPTQRFQTVLQFKNALTAIINPVVVPVPPPLKRPRSQIGVSVWILLLVSVLVLCLAGFGFIGGAIFPPPSTKTPGYVPINTPTYIPTNVVYPTDVPEPTEIIYPTQTAQPEPTEIIYPTPTDEYQCADKSLIKFVVGNWAITQKRNTGLYSAASALSLRIRILRKGEHIQIINGPVCYNGSTWWNVNTESSDKGWVREYIPEVGLPFDIIYP